MSFETRLERYLLQEDFQDAPSLPWVELGMLIEGGGAGTEGVLGAQGRLASGRRWDAGRGRFTSLQENVLWGEMRGFPLWLRQMS